MASSNDSQGLKIAVAIFVSLTVILAVTGYFLYSEMAKATEGLAKATTELQAERTKVSTANTSLVEIRDRAGYQNLSDPAAIMQQIDADQQALLESVNGDIAQINEAVARAQQAGANAAEIATIRDNLNNIIRQFTDESSQTPTFKASMGLLAAIASNQARLATALAADNVATRRQLENVDQVNQNELDTQMQAAQQASNDLAGEHTKYEQLFNDQRAKVDDLSIKLAELQSKNDTLSGQLNNQKTDYEGRMSNLLLQLNDWRTKAEKDNLVLDNADGRIKYVDYSTGRVRTDLTRSTGARAQMIFSVFDKDAPGLPSDKPKARIKLLQVGESDSVASIEEQFDKANPLRRGDQVYSAGFNPNDPERFALIGKMDLDRDGVDDREDLKRLIRAAGGIVEYDLPSNGQEQGELTPRSSWYVIDERSPIKAPSTTNQVADMTDAEEQFLQTRTEVVAEARSMGIRPMPIDRLLSSLGYSYGMMIPGKVEAADTEAIRRLLNPEGMAAPLPGSEEFERNRQESEDNAPF